MKAYVLSLAAREDLAELWEFIARDNIDAADRVLYELDEAMTRLAEMPEIGHQRTDVADSSLRCWVVRSYLIFYSPESNPLGIARIIHGARDVAAVLGS